MDIAYYNNMTGKILYVDRADGNYLRKLRLEYGKGNIIHSYDFRKARDLLQPDDGLSLMVTELPDALQDDGPIRDLVEHARGVQRAYYFPIIAFSNTGIERIKEMQQELRLDVAMEKGEINLRPLFDFIDELLQEPTKHVAKPIFYTKKRGETVEFVPPKDLRD